MSDVNMAQDIQPPYPPEDIRRAIGAKSLLDALIHFRDPTRPRRLRDRLFGVVLLAAALNFLNFYVWSGATVPVSSGGKLFMEFLSAAVIAYVMKELVARRIQGNVYREAPVSIVHRLGAAIVMTGVGILIYRTFPLRRWVLTSPVPPVILVSFLLGSILTLVWLIGYEKRNGPVYIVEETPRAST